MTSWRSITFWYISFLSFSNEAIFTVRVSIFSIHLQQNESNLKEKQ